MTSIYRPLPLDVILLSYFFSSFPLARAIRVLSLRLELSSLVYSRKDQGRAQGIRRTKNLKNVMAETLYDGSF